MPKAIHYRYSFILLFIVISYFAFTPFYVPSVNEDFGDKINHAGAFAALFLCFYRGYGKGALFTCFFLLGYGLFIECVQYLLPDRYFSLLDVLADSLGIALGFLFVRVTRRISF